MASVFHSSLSIFEKVLWNLPSDLSTEQSSTENIGLWRCPCSLTTLSGSALELFPMLFREKIMLEDKVVNANKNTVYEIRLHRFFLFLFFLTTRLHQEQNTPSISTPQDPLGWCREGHSGRLGQRWALFPGMQLSNQSDLNSSKVHLCVPCSKAAFLFFLQTIAYDRGLSSLVLLTFFSSRAFSLFLSVVCQCRFPRAESTA